MAGPSPDYFARLVGSANFGLLQSQRVVVVGVGTVGSRIAELLANSGVGQLCLIDHDLLQTENLYRHALPSTYLGWNKAVGLAHWLGRQVPGLQIASIDRRIDDLVPGELLERWLSDADLIVAATDDREAQRRIGRQALTLDVPTLFPGQYVEGGGEVFVQTGNRRPCFGCWDYFRTDREPLRGVGGLPFAELPVIDTTLRLCVGLLDPDSQYRSMLVGETNRERYQSFRIDRFGTCVGAPQKWRRNCPSCGGTKPPRANAIPTAESLRRPAGLTRRPMGVRPQRSSPSRQTVERPTGLTVVESLVSEFFGGLFVWWLLCLAVWFVVTIMFAIAGLAVERTESGKIILYSLYFGPVLLAVLVAVRASLFDRD